MSSANISPVSASLDSDLLRTFLAVVESGSISAGAERIGRSQSAASLQIKRLEEIVGQPVFERHGRGVTVTTVGEELLDVARRVVDLLDDGLGRIRSHDVTGTLRVGIPDEYGRDVLPEVLASFARHHPGVEVSVRCALSAQFPEMIQRGELDVAVHDVAVPKKRHRILQRERTVWVTSRRHRADLRSPIPVSVFDKDCWWHDAAIHALDRSGKNYRIAYQSESVSGIIAAIESGIAVGVIAADAMQDDFRELLASEGFPKLPNSTLIVEARPGIDRSLALPMCDAIEAAFARVSGARFAP